VPRSQVGRGQIPEFTNVLGYVNPGGPDHLGPNRPPGLLIHSTYLYINSTAISGGRIVLGNLLSWTPNR
jgi:hypothetical protein